MRFKIMTITLKDELHRTLGTINYNISGYEVWAKRGGYIGLCKTIKEAKKELKNYIYKQSK